MSDNHVAPSFAIALHALLGSVGCGARDHSNGAFG